MTRSEKILESLTSHLEGVGERTGYVDVECPNDVVLDGHFDLEELARRIDYDLTKSGLPDQTKAG